MLKKIDMGTLIELYVRVVLHSKVKKPTVSAYERKYSLSPRRSRVPVVDGKQEDDPGDT